jgi:Bax protein
MKYAHFAILLSVSLLSSAVTPKYSASVVPKNMSVETKKKRFYYLLVPAVEKVHAELMTRYKKIAQDVKDGENAKEIAKLRKAYYVKTDKELLACLKPHPQSIVLAQAALESSWGTSRFFTQAKNIFGIRSMDENEPRIIAGGKRVWLKKFDSVEASVRGYYKIMAKVKVFKEFRALRLQTDNPHELVKKLDEYSEIGAEYGKALSQVIRHNKLIRYDKKRLR